MWQGLPTIVQSPREREEVRTAAEAVLRVITDAVEVLVEGHQAARRQMIRHEESARRELVDDLLRGGTDVSHLVERAEPFGLYLGSSHHVLLAAQHAADVRVTPVDEVAATMERALVDRLGDRDVLVATKDNLLVVILPGEPRDVFSGLLIADPARYLHTRLARVGGGRWQVTHGRAYLGAYGVARSYEEAREALVLAQRLKLHDDVLSPHELLVYRVLGRDRAALVDLVQAFLTPLTQARGGAEPLLTTLDAYFDAGAVTAAAARALHVSVRTVTYRLARIHSLTGHDPADPEQHLALHMAVRGARLLDWPATPLP